MKIVALVPARKNSRGLPGKNIKLLCGKPLISYSIEAASRCLEIDKVYINSDSESYLEIGAKYGAEKFLRPHEHATDIASMKSVVYHFIKELEQDNENFDAVLVLYPVYPLRTHEDLTKIVEAFEAQGGNTPLIGLKKPSTCPLYVFKREASGRIKSVLDVDMNRYYRRQESPEYYELTHWALMLPTQTISKLNNQLMCSESFGYIVPKEKAAVNIDTPLDFEFAEFLLQNDQEELD